MKHIFFYADGYMRIPWIFLFGFVGLVAISIALSLPTAYTKARLFTRVTGTPMTTWEALCVDPAFTVLPGGKITVEEN